MGIEMKHHPFTIKSELFLNYDSKGARHVRITGPYTINEGKYNEAVVYKLGFWIQPQAPEPDAVPDFYVELDERSVINLRNMLSSVMLAGGITN